MKEVIRGVWKRKGFPKEWREGVITPIHKKEDKNKVENYRGITLLCTIYKLYASILAERLGKEVEDKNILPETQAGFRKGRSTMDNIYILNHEFKGR